jgi:hypothetical protein
MHTLLLIHILISLAGIASGFVVLGGWISARHLRGWTALFLLTTAATSLTGILLPLNGFTPAVALVILSFLALAVAVFALAVRRLAGSWQTVYAISGLTALYFNFFVLVAQLFQKIPPLRELAPTQAEPPFAISQTLVLALFIILGIQAVRRLRATRVV